MKEICITKIYLEPNIQKKKKKNFVKRMPTPEGIF